MTKEQVIQKLTSRKFWVSVASFVTMVMVAMGQSESNATQVASIIMAGATVLGYLLAEGLTDSKAVVTDSDTLVTTSTTDADGMTTTTTTYTTYDVDGELYDVGVETEIETEETTEAIEEEED